MALEVPTPFKAGFCETRLDAVSMCETVNCRADTFFVHDKAGMEARFRENMMEEMVQQSALTPLSAYAGRASTASLQLSGAIFLFLKASVQSK